MKKKHNYFEQKLGLDEKTSGAIKLLMDEGLLEPLLVDLSNAIENEEYQNITNGKNLYPNFWEKKEEMTPIERELVEESGLPIKTVREILEMT